MMFLCCSYPCNTVFICLTHPWVSRWANAVYPTDCSEQYAYSEQPAILVKNPRSYKLRENRVEVEEERYLEARAVMRIIGCLPLAGVRTYPCFLSQRTEVHHFSSPNPPSSSSLKWTQAGKFFNPAKPTSGVKVFSCLLGSCLKLISRVSVGVCPRVLPDEAQRFNVQTANCSLHLLYPQIMLVLVL